MGYPNIARVAAGRLNGWECQRITSRDGVLYLIERADGKLHEAPLAIHAKIDAAVDGVMHEGSRAEPIAGLHSEPLSQDKKTPASMNSPPVPLSPL